MQKELERHGQKTFLKQLLLKYLFDAVYSLNLYRSDALNTPSKQENKYIMFKPRLSLGPAPLSQDIIS